MRIGRPRSPFEAALLLETCSPFNPRLRQISALLGGAEQPSPRYIGLLYFLACFPSFVKSHLFSRDFKYRLITSLGARPRNTVGECLGV